MPLAVPKWVIHQVSRVGAAWKRPQAAVEAPEHHEVIIVGGGVAGLYTAYRLLQSDTTKIDDIVVLEGRPVVGGRVTTHRDGDSNVLFNDFGWRVGEVNKEMIALAKELDITLIPQVTPPEDKDKEGKGQCKHGPAGHVCSGTQEERDKYVLPEGRAPLSDFATASLISAAKADEQDRQSGYAGRTAQITWPDESHGTNAFIVQGGMDQYPKKLASKLPEGMVKTNHRVTNVSKNEAGTYTIDIMKRQGNSYTPLRMTADQVVLAAPPVSLRKLSVAEDMQPALFAVHQRRLGHVYVKCKETYPAIPDRSDVEDRIYRKVPDSILQQLISGDYGKGIFQAAYACDRFERVWRELQFHGPQSVMEQVKRQLTRIEDMKEPPAGWDDTIEEVFVRISFVHRWHIESHVRGKNKQDLSLQALAPNPARLPGLYLAGEAFSPEQGWTEGALWTGGRVATMIVRAKEAGAACSCSMSPYAAKFDIKKAEGIKLTSSCNSLDNFMLYRGIVFDISDWDIRHPGGVGMIRGHKNEDLSELFDNFHGGWPAPLASLFGLQIGVTEFCPHC
ncbi:Endoribonuclease L-PSP [Seminavis robusta]|uniref:monoamine oxidase n=1 Tax=Seminavis robusta TaxID=568900 RepID=A0A9N8H5M9_9STRA|nr:Endoribonuclease L-PSP [Seminavis robusta]|eukprot:Sro147_g067920.1 Endoribonuclease L-PSP (562) ;mRNA; r:70093-71865